MNVLHTTPRSTDEMDQIAVSPYVKNYTDERKKALLSLIPKEVEVLKFHQSLCPGCVDKGMFDTMKIDCVTYVDGGKVWMAKQCPTHGPVKEVYWSDYEMYKRAEKWQDPGIKILNPHVDKSQFDIDCPSDCGLCVEHESHTGLGNIVVTNRCDLTCWYCFFYAKENEPIYEPSLDSIKFMLKRMKMVKPVGANAVQITGGEPTLRDDILDILRAAKELGYDHVQLNTNGLRLANDPDFAMQVRAAGCNNLYMSFDGVTPHTGSKNYWEVPRALDNCRRAGLGVVLVPTVIGGVNDHELGDMIRFGTRNIDIVRSVNFQPVSLVGRIPDKLRKQQRITIPGAIKKIEEQTDGQVGREDFFPVPCAKQVTDFIEAIKEQPKYRLSIHFACGMATYVFQDRDRQNKLVPITRFFDVEGFFEYLGQLTEEIHGAKHRRLAKAKVIGKLLVNIGKYLDEKEKPKHLKFGRMLAGAMTGGNYHGLADFHYNSLFIGMMHFQDPYNWDIDRIHKCDIHYAVPDGRVLPFCTFNVIPEMYRDKIQRKYSVPAVEWERATGKSLQAEKYHRKLTPEEMRAIVAQYDAIRRSKERTPLLQSDWGQAALQQDFANVLLAPAAGSTSGLTLLGDEEAQSAGGCGSGCGAAKYAEALDTIDISDLKKRSN